MLQPRASWLRFEASAPLSRRWFWLAVLLIAVAAAVLRVAWLLGPVDPSMTLPNGTPILTSVDGYYFGVGAQSIIDGTDYARLRVPGAHEHALVLLTWLGAVLTPATLEQVMVYLPVLLGALLTIPVALVARELLGARAALFATALALASPGIVMRTSAGFLDTDPFALGVPLVALLFFIRLFDRGDARQGLYAALTLSLNRYFYDQGEPIGAAMAVLGILYLVFFHRRDERLRPYLPSMIAVLGLSVIDLPWYLRAPLVVIAWLALTRLTPRLAPRHAVLLGVALALTGLFLSLAWRSILYKLIAYAPGSEGIADGVVTGDSVVFGNTSSQIGEAARESLGLLGKRLTGTLVTTAIGLVGMLLLVVQRRSLVLALPIVAVGAFTLVGGARFAMHLGIPLALGITAFVLWLVQRLRVTAAIRFSIAAVLAVAAALPAVATAWSARPLTALVRSEVEAITALAARVQPGDSVIAWWDEGYPLSFYSHARTLVDGGRRGDDASLVAEVLMTDSQPGAANLARALGETANRLAGTDRPVAQNIYLDAERAGIAAADVFATFASPAYKAPPKTHEVYLYLPFRLLDDLATLDRMRPRMSKARPRQPRFELSRDTRTDGERLVLRDGRVVDGREVAISDRTSAARPMKGIIAVHGSLADPKVERVMRRPRAPTTGVYLDEAGVFMELDDDLVASTFMQLLPLRAPDPTCFELVFANASVAIYKVLR